MLSCAVVSAALTNKTTLSNIFIARPIAMSPVVHNCQDGYSTNRGGRCNYISYTHSAPLFKHTDPRASVWLLPLVVGSGSVVKFSGCRFDS